MSSQYSLSGLPHLMETPEKNDWPNFPVTENTWKMRKKDKSWIISWKHGEMNITAINQSNR